MNMSSSSTFIMMMIASYFGSELIVSAFLTPLLQMCLKNPYKAYFMNIIKMLVICLVLLKTRKETQTLVCDIFFSFGVNQSF